MTAAGARVAGWDRLRHPHTEAVYGGFLVPGLALLLLGYFKYTNFFVDNVNSVLSYFDESTQLYVKHVHLPIGISFFTFEAIAYLVDVRRGLTRAQRDPIKFGLFATATSRRRSYAAR